VEIEEECLKILALHQPMPLKMRNRRGEQA